MALTPTRRAAALCLSSLLGLASCGGDGGALLGLDEDSCPTPKMVDYVLDDQPPHVAGLTDATTLADVTMPMAVQGTDNGDSAIVYSALLMGYYMIGVQRAPGCVHEANPAVPCTPYFYEYDPRTNTNTDEESEARQLVGALAQTWFYRLSGRPEFKLSAKHAIESLLPWAKRAGEPKVRLHRGDRIWMKNAGVTSLLTMVICHYVHLTGDRSYDDVIELLGDTLVNRVTASGRIRAGSPLRVMQMHNALWRLYETTGQVRYLDALERAGRYAYDNRDKNEKGDLFENPYLYGLWAHEPLTELYTVRPADWIPELVFSVADGVMKKQYTRKNTKHCERVGGFKPNSGKGHPNWNHTLKLEAIADAYRLATLVGDTKRAATYRASAEAGAFFLSRFQWREDDRGQGIPLDRAIGGVPLFKADPKIRIDIPGHGGVAMAKTAAWLETERFPGAPPPVPASPAAEVALDADADAPEAPASP